MRASDIIVGMTSVVADLCTGIDWTAVIIASIAAGSATFAAWIGWLNAKAIRDSNRMLRTNGEQTVGEHMETLRAEFDEMAAEKTRADAKLAAAALAAVAKLTATEPPPPMTDQAAAAANQLVTTAQATAAQLKGTPRP